MEAQAKSIEEKAKKLADQLNEHHDAAKGVAEVINSQLPEDKKLDVPQLDEKASVKENTSKLVTFIEKLDHFVEELDGSLKQNLSAEKYQKVAKVTTPMEEILPIVVVVTKGLVNTVGPLVTAIAKKLKNSNVLKHLRQKLKAVHETSVCDALHDSHVKNGCVDECHPGIKENEHELDHAINSLEQRDTQAEDCSSGESADFCPVAKSLVAWHQKASQSNSHIDTQEV